MDEIGSIGQLKKHKLCYRCVEEEFLKEEIRRKGKRGKCSYCGGMAKQYSLEDISERVATAFEQHYVRTSDQPTEFEHTMAAFEGPNYYWERQGDQVVYAISDAAKIPEAAASDIQRILQQEFSDWEAMKCGEETEFAADSCYGLKGPDDAFWQREWKEFERSLKTEARYFSRAALDMLSRVFGGMDKMQTYDGRPIIAEAGPNTELQSVYRARSFESDDKLEAALIRPDQELGPPPPAFARAGRMNAHGISVFYGASKPEAAVAEVRPPVGSRVAVARFKIIRQIRLLDLAALKSASSDGSFFDTEYIDRLERSMFLANLSQRITIPVMPNDQAFEYLATQAIADFLATENNPAMDGIIFPSVQVSGKAFNVVLFRKAACVEEIEFPKGANVTADIGHAWEGYGDDSYAVFEEFPQVSMASNDSEKLSLENLISFEPAWDETEFDCREPTLKIDLESVKVHSVKAARFKTNVSPVSRHRLQRSGRVDF